MGTRVEAQNCLTVHTPYVFRDSEVFNVDGEYVRKGRHKNLDQVVRGSLNTVVGPHPGDTEARMVFSIEVCHA